MNVLFLFESVLPPDFFVETTSPGELRVIAAQKKVTKIWALGPQGTSFYDVPRRSIKTTSERKISMVRFFWPKGQLSYYLTWMGLLWNGWKICRKNRINVIHAESPHISGIAALILGKLFHAKVVVEYRVSYDKLLNYRYGWFGKRILTSLFWLVAGSVMRSADCVAANSKTYMSELEEKLSVKQIGFYNPGVNVPDNYVHAKNKEVKIGFLGRLYPDKGPEYLIEVISRYRHWWEQNHAVFVIGGDGPLLHSLQQTAQVRGLSHLVTFYGSIDRWVFFRYCDVLVNTTMVRNALEMVIAEAACVGIPCVAFGEAGCPETVKNGMTGMIIPPGNVKAMSTACKNLILNPVLRREMSQSTIRHGEQYRFKTQVLNLKKIYNGL